MNDDTTPEERKKIFQAWKAFVVEVIKYEKSAAEKGCRWLYAISCALDKTPTEIQKKLPDEHPLKLFIINSELLEKSNETNKINKRKSSTKAMNKHLVKTALESTAKKLKKALGNFTKIETIDFSGFPFECDIDFSNFIFPVDTDFKNTKFSKDILFENAVFYEDVNFENARFHETPKTYIETAKFKNALFMNTADFSKTVFNAYANFKGATFGGRTIFQQASFKYHAPRFYGAEFNNEIILNRIKLPEAKKYKENKNDRNAELYEKRIEENKSAYETLIHLMEKQNKHHERHRFFREEMRWRQLGSKLTQKRLLKAARRGDYENYSFGKLLGNSFTIVFFWLYDSASEYGHGIGRAFSWWAGHVLIGALILFGLRSYYCDTNTINDFGCSLGISLSNSHAFFFKSGQLEKCYKTFGTLPAFNVIWGVQTITGTLLIFLLLLTLRIRFRIK